MRQNSVERNRFTAEICQDESSKRVKVEKPHSVCSWAQSRKGEARTTLMMLRVETCSRDRAKQAEKASTRLL
jgi:hypothetical protein